jgi:hypothetical protein
VAFFGSPRHIEMHAEGFTQAPHSILCNDAVPSNRAPGSHSGSNVGRIPFGVNRTAVNIPSGELRPGRIRRVATRRRSSVMGSCVDRRSRTRRSTITFTPGTCANDHVRCSYRAVSFRRTTMSNAASGNDREGRASRTCIVWLAQMLCVSCGSSNGSRSPRSPGLPSRTHHAQTTFILASATPPLQCHPSVISSNQGSEFPSDWLKPPLLTREITGSYLITVTGRSRESEPQTAPRGAPRSRPCSSPSPAPPKPPSAHASDAP